MSQPLNKSSGKTSAPIGTDFLSNTLPGLGINCRKDKKSNKNKSVSIIDTPQPASQDLVLALPEPHNEIENERDLEAVATAQQSHNKNNKRVLSESSESGSHSPLAKVAKAKLTEPTNVGSIWRPCPFSGSVPCHTVDTSLNVSVISQTASDTGVLAPLNEFVEFTDTQQNNDIQSEIPLVALNMQQDSQPLISQKGNHTQILIPESQQYDVLSQ